MSIRHELSPPGGVPRPGRHRTSRPPLPLTQIAEVLAEGTAQDPADLVVVCGDAEGVIDLGLWPIPPEVDHPTDVLVGWRPPPWVSVVGLVTTGEARSADSIDAIRVTVLTADTGQTATVLERSGRSPETIAEPPVGWGADALRRCLDLPTPPPAQQLHPCVEANWLREVHRLASEASVHGSSPTWDQVALVHPLHPPGWPAPPNQLRAATAALDLESSWEDMSRLLADSELGVGLHPPGGEVIAFDQWFDAGSLARWSLRHLPDVEDLLFEVLDLLPAHVGAALVDALVSTTSWQP